MLEPARLNEVDISKLPPTLVERWRRCVTWGGLVAQHPAEMAEVFRQLQQAPPVRFLEIGSQRGGSLYIYAGTCAPGATVVCIDLGEDASFVLRLEETIKHLQAEGFQVTRLHANSHLKETVTAAEQALGGPVDFLHIDSDHSLAGVRQDWSDYGVLVRPGGLIAFHDIAWPLLGTLRFWQDVGKEKGARTIALGPIGGHRIVGIGLLRKTATKASCAAAAKSGAARTEVDDG